MRLWNRLYRAALFLLPAEMRRSYGPAMLEEARHSLEEARGAGVARLATATLGLFGDLLLCAGREWRAAAVDVGRAALPGARTDLRFVLRGLRRSPGFTVAVLTTLSLGIGANTAIFSVVDAALLRPLPYAEADALVSVWPGKLFSRQTLEDAQRSLTTLDGVAGYGGRVFTVTENGPPAEIHGFEVSPNHFEVLGVGPALGRSFSAEDGAPGAEPVALLSHGLWVERFAASVEVLGRSVALQSGAVARHVVVGVMPVDYEPVRAGVDVWVPVVSDPSVADYADSNFMEAIGRVAPGRQPEAVRAEVRAWAARLMEEGSPTVSRRDIDRATVVPLAQDLAGNLRFQLFALMGAVGLVLLIACVNVANLLLARVATRARELGVRAALGAGRTRIMRQLLGESLVLGLGGAALGVVLAVLTRDVLLGLLPASARGTPEVALDLRVMAFTLIVGVGASLVFGVAPAFQAARRGAAAAAATSRSGGSEIGSRRLQHVLMASEVALALVAVFAAGLLTRAVHDLSSTDPGFEPAGVLSFRLTASPERYPEARDVVDFYDAVRARLAAIPGVEAVGTISRLPLGISGRSEITIYPEGLEPPADGELPEATHRLISPGYAEAMRFRLREGRVLTEVDVSWDDPNVGYVNATLADRFFPDGALGKTFYGRGGVRWLTVIGVVEDVRDQGLDVPPQPAVYVPHKDWALRTMTVVVRTPMEPRSIVADVEAAVWQVEPNVPVTRVRPMTDLVAVSIRRTRTTGALFAFFGGLALLLGCVGVYGVVADSLGRRRKEFGIRVALGASSRRVATGALGATGLSVAVGLVAGGTLTPMVGSWLAASLSGVPARSPGVLLATGATLAVVALVTSWIPARRAARIDPVESLRAE